jgi:hypothetical protein
MLETSSTLSIISKESKPFSPVSDPSNILPEEHSHILKKRKSSSILKNFFLNWELAELGIPGFTMADFPSGKGELGEPQ